MKSAALARAPGKIIITGEHAVVYGSPALAVAVDRFAESRVHFNQDSVVELTLIDLGSAVQMRWEQIQSLYQACQQRHQQYTQGLLPIEAVLERSTDLACCAIGELLALLGTVPEQGVTIEVKADIPLGAGMGSSAATTAALILSLSELLRARLSKEQLQQATTVVEQLQHGRSSGLDPAVVCQGGFIALTDGQVEPLGKISAQGWYLMNTGTPASSTGECVQAVRQSHGNSDIWDEFSKVSLALRQGLQSSNIDLIQTQLRRNHRLLCQLGVVPAAVQTVVSQLEAHGLAAKISGAGSLTGDAAGALLIYSPQGQPQIEELSLPIMPLSFNYQGVELE